VYRVDGCLDHYVPEPRGGGATDATGDEHWRVAGREFRYAKGDMGRTCKHSALDKGPVRADSRVRVRYIVDPVTGWNRIVRLEVADRACPYAPRNEG
jgi:hypothetical protein